MIMIKVTGEPAIYSSKLKPYAMGISLAPVATYTHPSYQLDPALCIAHELGHVACARAGHAHWQRASIAHRGFRELSEAEACAWRWAVKKRGGFTKREGRMIKAALYGYLWYRKRQLVQERRERRRSE